MPSKPTAFLASLFTMASIAIAQDKNAQQAVEQKPAAVDHKSLFSDLLQPQFAKRKQAIEKLNEWVKANPQGAKSSLLELASESTEPEIRERAISLLRFVAMSEYGSFGEGYCGIQMDIPSLINLPGMGQLSGMPLRFVTPEGPAAKAGVKVNDVIFAIDEKTWDDPTAQSNELRDVIRQKGAGTTIDMHILRNDKIMRIPVLLTRRPPQLDNLGGGGVIQLNGGNIQLQGGRIQLQGGNLQLGGGQFIVPQGNGIDKAAIEDAIKQDKESDAFFMDWLKKQKELLKSK